MSPSERSFWLGLALPTLTLALFSQTLLYWSDCLMVALRHWDNSFYHCYPPHFNTLPSLYMNVFLTIGACWIRTHVKPISLIYRAGTSKFKRDPPGVENTGRTTCLQQIKEPIQLESVWALTQSPIRQAPVVNKSLLFKESISSIFKEKVNLSQK